MRYVEVNGVRVSAIGLGTWQFGFWEWGYGDAYAQHEALTIVRRALDRAQDTISRDQSEAHVGGPMGIERVSCRASFVARMVASFG
jgi:hypothetical protein